MTSKKTNKKNFHNWLVLFFAMFIAVSSRTIPIALAENAVTPEEILEKFSTDLNDPNPYFDRMYFSDEFKAEVIQKVYGATPQEYDQCMRQQAQQAVDELHKSIEKGETKDYSAKIVYTDKKIINPEYERLDYDIITTYFDQEPVEDKRHEFSYFIKKDGKWYIDLMPEYREKKATGQPFDMCDAKQIRSKNKAEQAGLILTEGTSAMPNNMTIIDDGEEISIYYYDPEMYVNLKRGDRDYQFHFKPSLPKGNRTFMSDDFDWNSLKENIAVSQKVANILAAAPTRYINQVGAYMFDLTPGVAGIWNSRAYIEIDLKKDMFYERVKEVYLNIDINSGTVKEDQKEQQVIDKKTEDRKEQINTRERNKYIASAIEAGMITGTYLLIAIIMILIIRIVLKTPFRVRNVLLTVVSSVIVWFALSFMSTSSMTIRVVSWLHLPWPFGIIFGIVILNYLFVTVSILIVGIIGYRFLRKTGLSPVQTIVLVIIFSIVQLALISPIKFYAGKYTRPYEQRINF